MADVYNLIFVAFESVINTMKRIPVFDNVSLYDFSIGIIIFSVVFVGILSVVRVGSTNSILRSERAIRSNRSTESEEE